MMANYGWEDMLSHLFGSYEPDDLLTNFFNPAQVRMNEAAVNAMLWKMQADYESPENQMKRMKAAGINSNTAAAGIAGGGSSGASVQAPSSAQGAAAQNLSSLAQVASSIGNIMQGAAANRQAGVAEQKMPSEIDKLNAEAATEWEKMGLTAAERQIAETNLKYADESAFRDLQIKRVNVHMVNQQYKNLKAQHDNIIAEYDEILARKDLAISQKEYYDTLEAKTNEEQKWLKIQREFWEQQGYDLNANGVHNIIAQMVARDVDPEPFIEKYVGYIGRYQTALSEAEQAAIDKYAYSIASRRRRGENIADLVYGQVGSLWGFVDKVFRNIMKNVDDFVSFGGKSVEQAYSWISEQIKNKQYNNVRNYFQDILEDLRAMPNPSPDIQESIDSIEMLLQMSNKELYDYWSKSKK